MRLPVLPRPLPGPFAPAGMASQGGPPAPGGEDDKKKAFEMAKQEMEYRVELFGKLTASCFDKCIDRKFKEGDLNVGENSCIDRCAAKYWQVTGIVGQMLGGGSQ